MKQTKLIALLLALALICLLFAACDGADPAVKSAAGSYEGLYTKIVGDSEDVRDTNQTFSLVLTADGKGTHYRDEMEFEVTWTLEGDAFTMKEVFIGDPIQYTGTLKDGYIEIYNGDPEAPWTVEYVYQKK